MTLKPHELKLAVKLLNLAADQFSNHGCNDFDLVEDGGLSLEEAEQINRCCAEKNGDIEDWSDEDLAVSHAVFGDDGLMSFLAIKLKEESDRT